MQSYSKWEESVAIILPDTLRNQVFYIQSSEYNKIMLTVNVNFWHKNNQKNLNNLILKMILLAVEELTHYASENL